MKKKIILNDFCMKNRCTIFALIYTAIQHQNPSKGISHFVLLIITEFKKCLSILFISLYERFRSTSNFNNVHKNGEPHQYCLSTHVLS
jgi:transcriptional regulator NrdR family protein